MAILIGRFQGEENLGMAMTFTLVSHLREQLYALIQSRAEHREREEAEKERLALEVRIYAPSIDDRAHRVSCAERRSKDARHPSYPGIV